MSTDNLIGRLRCDVTPPQQKHQLGISVHEAHPPTAGTRPAKVHTPVCAHPAMSFSHPRYY